MKAIALKYKVYNIRHKNDGTYYPVGGENRTDAILNYLREIGEDSSDFIHYRATLARNKNGETILTDNNGFIDMEELMPKGYPSWWHCPECFNEEDFEYAPVDGYKCLQCGYEGNIPFSF